MGGGYINASLKELRINEEKGPSVNVFDRLWATGGSKASPFNKKKKKKLGRILFKRKALLVTDFFFFFEFIYTWWLHYSPSPTAGQRAVAAAGAEEVNASLKAFSVVLSTAHEHYISTPQQNVPAGKWICF